MAVQHSQISIKDLLIKTIRRSLFMSKIICIYDRIKNTTVEVEVSDEVYTHYMRTEWNIKDNDESFFKHEIQFSALKGNINGSIDNFHESVSDRNDVEKNVIDNIMIDKLNKCLAKLSDKDRKLIEQLYFEGKTERECAKIYGINQKNIHKKKVLILGKINKLLEKF